MPGLDVLVLYNRPVLGQSHPDRDSEAGVLDALAAIDAALRSAGHHPRPFALTASPAGLASLLDEVIAQRPAVVFNLCEGLTGTGAGESQVAGLVELLALPCTGSDSRCLALVRDKARLKWLLKAWGLPTPSFELVRCQDPIDADKLKQALLHGPLIVKPACEDASLGIGPASIVSQWPALSNQVDRLRSRYGDVLVEQFIPGREFNAAWIGLEKPCMLPLSEIAFAAGALPLVTYDAKWSPHSAAWRDTPVQCPAIVDPPLARQIERLSLAALRASGCSQYARVDWRVDSLGQPYILEVNANPDLSPAAGLARAWAAAGKDYNDLVIQLVEHALGQGLAQSLPVPRDGS